jgi:hypothetical protein
MSTGASIAHSGAPSNQKSSYYPGCYILLLVDRFVVIEHDEGKTVLPYDFISENLVQNRRNSD